MNTFDNVKIETAVVPLIAYDLLSGLSEGLRRTFLFSVSARS